MDVTCTQPGCPNEGLTITLPAADVVVCGGCNTVLHDPNGITEPPAEGGE